MFLPIHSYMYFSYIINRCFVFCVWAILFILSLANLNVKSIFLFFNHLFVNISNTGYRLLIKVGCSVKGFYFTPAQYLYLSISVLKIDPDVPSTWNLTVFSSGLNFPPFFWTVLSLLLKPLLLTSPPSSIFPRKPHLVSLATSVNFKLLLCYYPK